MSINIYLTNLRKYNDGVLSGKWVEDSGKWVELPISEDDLQEELDEVLGDDEEYFITDWECPRGFEIGKYSNLYSLNEEAEEYEDILRDKFGGNEEALELALSEYDNNISRYESADVYIFNGDMSDVAREYISTYYPTQDIPSVFLDYFDFSAYGEYLEESGNFVIGDGFVVEIVE